MSIIETKPTGDVKELFSGWQETLIWSALDEVMGDIYVDNEENVSSAMIIIGDFCFFAGVPNRKLVSFKPKKIHKDFIIMMPQNLQWGKLIEEVYKEKAKKCMRYAIKKEKDVFDVKKLQGMVEKLDEKFSIKLIDETIYKKAKEDEWAKEWVAQYKTYEDYKTLGLGVVILDGEKMIAGASSYSSYKGGIEIEIDTKEEYRRMGLATVCGAKLILECLKRGLYPSWDAANKWSVALAEKLGYHFDHEYEVYQVRGWGNKM